MLEGQISIIIITRNTKELIGDLLRSIHEDGPAHSVTREIILVDNGSTDGTDALIAREFPEIVYIRNSENVGFAAAVNRGVTAAAAPFILLLNSDTRLIPGDATKMLQFMRERNDVAICGPQLVYEDMKRQRSFAAVPSLLLEIVPRSILEVILPRSYPDAKRPPQVPTDVDSLVGAAIMLRREFLERHDGFDEGFFFFLEETDLCVRARKAGWRVVFFPDARIVHLQGKTVRKTWVKGRIEYNISLYKFIKKHHGPLYLGVFSAVRLLKSSIFVPLLTALPFLLINERIRRSYRYYVAYLLWHLKGCPDDYGLKGLHP